MVRAGGRRLRPPAAAHAAVRSRPRLREARSAAAQRAVARQLDNLDTSLWNCGKRSEVFIKLCNRRECCGMKQNATRCLANRLSGGADGMHIAAQGWATSGRSGCAGTPHRTPWISARLLQAVTVPWLQRSVNRPKLRRQRSSVRNRAPQYFSLAGAMGSRQRCLGVAASVASADSSCRSAVAPCTVSYKHVL